MNERQPQILDLEKVIESKAGEKARRIPKFLIRWFKNFMHLDFINEYLKEGYVGVEFCENCLKYLGVEIEVNGLAPELYFVFLTKNCIKLPADHIGLPVSLYVGLGNRPDYCSGGQLDALLAPERRNTYRFPPHQSLPCVKGAVKNLFDFWLRDCRCVIYVCVLTY